MKYFPATSKQNTNQASFTFLIAGQLTYDYSTSRRGTLKITFLMIINIRNRPLLHVSNHNNR